jgi:uncharacterized protein (TIGR03083 family)
MSEFALDLDVDFSEHLEAIRESLAAFVDHARHAGLDAPVPTAPEWSVRQLVAHQGMVHRWATDNVLGRRSDPGRYETEGLESSDPVNWLHEGALRLVRTLEEAPADLEAPVFLNDAPTPRQFWARRQCHETTIHSVDALSARLGRVPTAAETWVTRQIALDGIDELLVGFLTRPQSRLRSEEPLTFVVRPSDVRRSWSVRVSGEPPVVERAADSHADVVLEGTAEQLYLALWNRSDEVQTEGYDLWRRAARITWS